MSVSSGSCEAGLSTEDLAAAEALYQAPSTPSTDRCQAWSSETLADPTEALSGAWKSRLSQLAAYWLRPFAESGVTAEALRLRVPEDPPAVEVFNGVAEGRSCTRVMVSGGRVFVSMPRYARTYSQSLTGCNVTNEKGRLTTVLRLLLLTLRTSTPPLPDFQFQLCGDDFCHGLWEQRGAAPLFTMVSCSSAQTIPAIQWNTLEARDPDLSVWPLTIARRRQLRELHAKRWGCKKSVAIWRGSLNDMYTYNLYWSENRTVSRRKVDLSNWQRSGRAALAYQRCTAGSKVVDVRFKLLRSRLHFEEAKQCVQAASVDKPNRMSMPDQVRRFKYMVHVEGNGGWADRLRHIFLSGALVMKQDMGVREWFEPLLEPWSHFVPVSSTLHNLSDAVHWARAHDAQAAAMAARAAELVEAALSEPAVVYYQAELFRQYSRLWRSPPLQNLPPLTEGFTRAEFRCSFGSAQADRPGSPVAQYITRDCHMVDEASGREVSSLEEVALLRARMGSG